MTRIRCNKCGVWIPVSESRPENMPDPYLILGRQPSQASVCRDAIECYRREVDHVSIWRFPYIRPGKAV